MHFRMLFGRTHREEGAIWPGPIEKRVLFGRGRFHIIFQFLAEWLAPWSYDPWVMGSSPSGGIYCQGLHLHIPATWCYFAVTLRLYI